MTNRPIIYIVTEGSYDMVIRGAFTDKAKAEAFRATIDEGDRNELEEWFADEIPVYREVSTWTCSVDLQKGELFEPSHVVQRIGRFSNSPEHWQNDRDNEWTCRKIDNSSWGWIVAQSPISAEDAKKLAMDKWEEIKPRWDEMKRTQSGGTGVTYL